MQKVGFKLIEIATDNLIQKWGGVYGQQISQPEELRLPNGDIVHGASVDVDYGGYKLIDWLMDAPDPIPQNLVDERARRLSVGFYYDFKDSRGVHHIGTSDQDMIGWADVTNWASSQIALNKTDTVGIITNTGLANVTALDWMKILDAATSFRQPIWTASFLLNPIPQDYADDKYWPSAPVNPVPPKPQV